MGEADLDPVEIVANILRFRLMTQHRLTQVTTDQRKNLFRIFKDA